jgi:hypothetical protein
MCLRFCFLTRDWSSLGNLARIGKVSEHLGVELRGIEKKRPQSPSDLWEGRTMSIRVNCPNGHPLRVNETLAGKTGLCPVCKALVKVPEPMQSSEISEDQILNFLGPHQPAGPRKRENGVTARAAVDASAEGPVPPKKSCARCNQEIPATTHVCPFCHTYIGGAAMAR